MAVYTTCPNCGANLDPGEACDCSKNSLTANEIIKKAAKEQEDNGCSECPRCGSINMYKNPVKNALSRRADIYICSACGTEEAIEDVARMSFRELNNWTVVRKAKRERVDYSNTLPQPLM